MCGYSKHTRFLLRQHSSLPSHNGTIPPVDDDDWEFGKRINDRRTPLLLRQPESTYHLDLTEHSGVIVGLTESGISMSLLRIGSLAAEHGWNVVFFDPLSSMEHAAEFTGIMRQAGCAKTYQFPGNTVLSNLDLGPAPYEPLACWPGGITASASPPSLPFAVQWYLDNMLTNKHDDEEAETEGASAAYIGVNVWSQPEESRAFARLLLTNIIRAVSEGEPGDRRMLLLIKHPELLFDMEQVTPLFALMDQMNGSIFMASRSVADLGWQASTILKDAPTLIVHRSHPSWEMQSCISTPWWAGHASFNRSIHTFPDDECFVIHEGEATHIRVMPVDPGPPIGAESSVYPPTDSSGAAAHLPWLDLDIIDDDDIEALCAHLFGPGEAKQKEQAHQDAPRRAPYHAHCIRLSSPDEANLSRALLLLGREQTPR